MDGSDTPQFEIRSTLLSDVEPERVEFIWPGRLAAGKLTLIDGDPGAGKTTLALDIAARITTGEPFEAEGLRRNPAGVILMSAEDGAGDTLRPRMEAAGADLTKVAIVDKRTEDGAVVNLKIPDDVLALKPIIQGMNARLMVIDPIMAFIGGDLSANNDQDVRAALSPLTALADQEKCAILIIRHMNKSVGASPMYRGGGSIGIIGAARFGFIAARDPNDPVGQRRVLAPQKINIGAEPPAIGYTLESVEGTDVARVAWQGVVDINAEKLLQAAKSESERSAIKSATEWLRDYMSTGEKKSSEIRAAANKDGIKPSHLDEAKDALGIRFVKAHGEWVWRYPYNQPPPQDDDDPDTWED